MPAQPANDAPHRLIRDVTFGEGVLVRSFTNLYGCRIGDRTRVGAFVEIQAGVTIGSDCKIRAIRSFARGSPLGTGSSSGMV